MEKYPYLNEAVANILKGRREALGMSKRKLSELAMIERAYITGLENGKWNVSLNVLFFLSEALEIKPDAFIRLVIDEAESIKKSKDL
ncbi:helix-turn-helix domain-containing protein [Desulfovibrio sp. UIB00]|uniref:helix-turn-helix domain-containing protein n=1 Tax=Desulfovibrio sp. UIB00 TaxID=2804314 RepID=UPI001F103C68|nr:helix-turn-helix transcriptional regulator [Desulfovibrio sp. UIB00]MCH5143519.1 helix-turn-helix transcriptional regulator [Desulfovibrio sp. UIB00]